MSSTETYIEVIALSALSLLIAAALTPVAVWCGVCVAYLAFLRSGGIKPVTVAERAGFSVVSFNLSSSVSFCLIVRQRTIYNQWAMQLQGV